MPGPSSQASREETAAVIARLDTIGLTPSAEEVAAVEAILRGIESGKTPQKPHQEKNGRFLAFAKVNTELHRPYMRLTHGIGDAMRVKGFAGWTGDARKGEYKQEQMYFYFYKFRLVDPDPVNFSDGEPEE
jgi:hypothetical protein